ncbi:MAG: HDOD domain-containing protein [Verrucomicrobiae bacterium]|nr:HDOD domain-containing protein [Verrucomicrobiae bacterium]MDW8343613.1 HDOD domain-containing protein [Verrucomicrobiae bacterium]
MNQTATAHAAKPTGTSSLDDYINRAHHLVPAPAVLPQLLPLLNQPDVNTGRVVELISYSQTVTANVLRICNSAYYSRGTPIDSLAMAVSRIGFRQIYEIVVSVISAATLARPQKGYGVEGNEMWCHSVTSAIAAQIIAREAQLDEQVVFTAAILHDVGKIVLSVALEDRKEQVQKEMRNNLSPLELELKLLGVNHAEVGGRLLEKWKLPEHLCQPVRFHHNPAGANGHGKLAACLYLGNFVAYFMGNGFGQHALDLKGRDAALKLLDLSSDRLPQFMASTQEQFKKVKHMYNLN